MASLTEIPEELLATNKRLDFLMWLIRLPANYDVRREFASLWSRATSTALEAEQWDFIRRNSQ